jgi:4'-phosphopantetheinyl transferase
MSQTVWQAVPPSALVLDDRVHIWRIPLNIRDTARNKLSDLLNNEEIRRANRFHFDKHRFHYIVARGKLRKILALYTEIDPALIEFDYNEYGKPFLRYPVNGPYFNLSHSRDMAVLAFSSKHEVGIDIEYMELRDTIFKIARRFFSETEVEELMNLPADDQLQGFFNCWTRKEAYIKGKGKGLSIPLASFSVTLSPGAPVALIHDKKDVSAPSGWSFSAFDVDQHYAAAVAVNSASHELAFWDANE